MSGDAYGAITPFEDFARVVDPGVYRPLPDDWRVGAADVVASRVAIAAGRYRAVNMAGAATISAVVNALSNKPFPFVFGGDGCRFAVAPEDAGTVQDAMARTASWARRELTLDLRVGMTPVASAREAGLDVRVARYAASRHASYAMFSGGGVEWVEQEVKAGRFHLDQAPDDAMPDLTGLSCQWGPIETRSGVILSMIVKPNEGTPPDAFAALIRDLLALLGPSERQSPVPDDGPSVSWPSDRLLLQARTMARERRRRLAGVIRTGALAGLAWFLFKTGLRIGGFDPGHYRRVTALNTDYRKFDDGLMMTVDCTEATATAIRRRLDKARDQGAVAYGLHRQKSAVMTCIAPSVFRDGHLHFLDGGGGGYTQAAEQLALAEEDGQAATAAPVG